MLHYTLRRFGAALILMLVVSFAAFILVFAAGDPSVKLAGEAGTAADAARIREVYGFDRPIIVQFGSWLYGALHGNLGHSLYFDQPVSAILLDRLRLTMALGGVSILFAVAVAVPLGILAARYQNTIVDRIALILAVVGQAMPTFWFALMLVVLFSVTWQVLPTSGSETWRHFIMPTVVLAYFALPAIMRLTRSGMIGALETDYIRTARAMGIAPW